MENTQNLNVHTDFDEEFFYFSRLSRLSGLFCLLLIIIPMVFLGAHQTVFFLLAISVSLTVLSLLVVKNLTIDTIYLKILAVLFMGVTLGLLRYDPVPSLSIVLLVLFSVFKLNMIEKSIVLISFVLFSTISFFICSSVLNEPATHRQIWVDCAAVFALGLSFFINVSVDSINSRILQSKYNRSKDRYSHFVKLANKLARYSPAPVWQKVVSEEKDVSLGNTRRKLTVFFSDIKGFTDLSDTMSAEELTQFLNTYFESMSKIAKKHGGTIDKFIGDALMVFFGDPDTKGEREDALACVEMAVDMTRELARLRNYWSAMGFDGLHVRMGINTGYCHVGNFGSATRLSYTAIGREVNMAARIQSAARPNTVLISDETHKLIQHRFLCQKGESMQLKGFSEPVPVWEIRRHRQEDEIKDAHWLEHDMPGFNLHLNMLNIKDIDRENIRRMLVKAGRIVDASIKKDKGL